MARSRRTQRAPRAPQQEDDITIIPCVIKGAHNTTIRETEDFYKAQKTVKDHCRRLNEMIKWVQIKYAVYYSEAVRELPEEERADKIRYYTSIHDFLYQSLNVEVSEAF